MPDAYLTLFGVPTLRDGDRNPRKLRTRKQLGLLVYLTLEARVRPVPRDVLADLLWPGAPPERARHSLAQALTAIRGHVGVNSLSRGGDGVRVLGGVNTDLDRVASLSREDVEDPLVGLEHWAGPEFAHWVERARVRIRRLARERLLAAVDRHRSRGELDAVYRCAAALYRLDPVSNVAVHALADAALARGDLSGAIRLLTEHAERAKRELDGTVPRDVVRLLDRLKAGAHPPVDTLPARLAARAQELRPVVFVGRQAEIAYLEAAWNRARSGGVRSYLVVGPGGIGKSSLIRRFATGLAARAHPVFLVNCQEIGQGIPFAATADLIDALCRDPSLSGTDPLWLAEASRVHPALKAVYPGIPEPPPAPAESIRVRVAEALLQMLETVSDGQPFAIVFDDAQHMDPATRDILYVLARRLEERPGLIVGTHRSHGTVWDRTGTGRAGRDFRWDDSLVLQPLSDQVVHRLIDELSGDLPPDSPVRHKIVELSDGNPYFAEMLVLDWEQHAGRSLVASAPRRVGEPPPEWRPPDTLRVAFARLLEDLDERARTSLQLLAVANKGLSVAEIRRLFGDAESAIDVTLVDLLERGVVCVLHGALRFKNELHQAYVYYNMSEETRKYMHLQVADCIRWGKGDADFQAGLECGHHLLRAGADQDAVTVLASAARAALARGAPREAEDALLATASCNKEFAFVDRMLMLATAQVMQGEYSRALGTLLDVTSQPLGRQDSARARVLTVECHHRGLLRSRSSLLDEASDLLELTMESGTPETVAHCLQITAEIAAEFGKFDDLDRVEGLTRKLVSQSGSSLGGGLANLTLGYCCLVRGRTAEAITCLERSAEKFEAQSNFSQLGRVLNGLGIAFTAEGMLTRACNTFREGIILARRCADATRETTFYTNLAVVHHDRARYDDAVRACRDALQRVETVDDPRLRAIVNLVAAALAMDAGDYSGADTFLTRAERNASCSPVPRDALDVALARADYHLACNEPERAWPLVQMATKTQEQRLYMLGETARYERLRRHHTLASIGYEAYLALVGTAEATMTSMPKAARLEVAAFDAWAMKEYGGADDSSARSVVREAAESDLIGVLAHLITVHTCPIWEMSTPSQPSIHQAAQIWPTQVQLPSDRTISYLGPFDVTRKPTPTRNGWEGKNYRTTNLRSIGSSPAT